MDQAALTVLVISVFPIIKLQCCLVVVSFIIQSHEYLLRPRKIQTGYFTHIKAWFKTFKASTPKITRWKWAPEVMGLLQRKRREHLAKVQTQSQQSYCITYVNYMCKLRMPLGIVFPCDTHFSLFFSLWTFPSAHCLSQQQS